ncbi:TPA: hypothetical protein ACIZC1_002793 [Enterococcus faecalis]
MNKDFLFSVQLLIPLMFGKITWEEVTLTKGDDKIVSSIDIYNQAELNLDDNKKILSEKPKVQIKNYRKLNGELSQTSKLLRTDLYLNNYNFFEKNKEITFPIDKIITKLENSTYFDKGNWTYCNLNKFQKRRFHNNDIADAISLLESEPYAKGGGSKESILGKILFNLSGTILYGTKARNY